MTITKLAKLMDMPAADVQSFVVGLSVWTAKGYSLEKAINLHMQQMARFANNATSPEMRELAIEALYA